MLFTIEELSEQGRFKAFRDFIDFAEYMGHDASHTIYEFIETSNVNNWMYDTDGKFVQ